MWKGDPAFPSQLTGDTLLATQMILLYRLLVLFLRELTSSFFLPFEAFITMFRVVSLMTKCWSSALQTLCVCVCVCVCVCECEKHTDCNFTSPESCKVTEHKAIDRSAFSNVLLGVL